MAESVLYNKNELSSMTVVQLKKLLTKRGLSPSGNKADLIQRLLQETDRKQDADLTEIDASSTKCEFTEDTSSNDYLVIKEENQVVLSLEKSNMIQESSRFPEIFGKSLISSTDSHLPTNVSKPLKKRILSENAAESTAIKKRLLIKRDNIPTPKLTENSEGNAIVKNISYTEKKQSSSKPSNTLTNIEKLEIRAKRFNLSSNKLASPFIPESSKDPILLQKASLPQGVQVAVLRKRAERFGVTVSPVMKKAEEKQKLIDRKTKFGVFTNLSTRLDEETKKKQRAARFGI